MKKMNDILISIIIPVYKCEKYIGRCARNLMEQTIRDGIEFIFVNDCTPDASMDFLRNVLCRYPEREHQVRLIENDCNLGVFETRKRGLAFANGDYVGWCDSDDWCEPTMFERMYKATKGGNVDVVICNYFEHGEQTYKQCLKHYSTPHEILANLWRGRVFSGSLWHQIYRREILVRSMDLVVPTNYGEDNYTNMYMQYFSSSIAYVDECLYHLDRTNEVSLMKVTQLTREEWKKQKENTEKITKLLYSNGGKNLFRVAMNSWKFGLKERFRNAFPNIFIFYFTFRECYKDVNTYLFTPKEQRFKTYLIYNFFPLFWWYTNKGHKL